MQAVKQVVAHNESDKLAHEIQKEIFHVEPKEGESKAEFQKRWAEFLIKGDPYYNKNLSCDTEQYNIKTTKVL